MRTATYNLIGDAGNAGGLVDGVNGNIVGVDPALVFGPLADNGGPTPTHAALARQSGDQRRRPGVRPQRLHAPAVE